MLLVRSKMERSFHFRRRCSKMDLKINHDVKTPWHRPSMGFARLLSKSPQASPRTNLGEQSTKLALLKAVPLIRDHWSILTLTETNHIFQSSNGMKTEKKCLHHKKGCWVNIIWSKKIPDFKLSKFEYFCKMVQQNTYNIFKTYFGLMIYSFKSFRGSYSIKFCAPCLVKNCVLLNSLSLIMAVY